MSNMSDDNLVLGLSLGEILGQGSLRDPYRVMPDYHRLMQQYAHLPNPFLIALAQKDLQVFCWEAQGCKML